MNEPINPGPSAATSRSSTLQLMGTTPLRDAFRGRLTGRLDIARACERAALPPAIRDLVLRTVRSTRLWRVEKAEVGAELISHFRDGLDASRTPDELITSFGDAAVAARLIRRAKQQSRPLPWKFWILAWKCLGALLLLCILFYAFLFIRLHVGSSTLRLNATKELNEATLTIPVNERAWPVYKEALLLLERTPDELAPLEVAWPRVPADSPLRPHALAYLERQRPAIELIHKAAALPYLGYVVSHQIEPDMPGYNATSPGQTWDDPAWNDNPPAVFILLPYLGVLRNFTSILVFDSMVAREHNDDARVMLNLRTTIAIGQHAREVPVVIADLVGLAVLSRACDEVFETLETAPSLLSDAQLLELAHTLSAFPRDGGELVRIETEAYFFEDVLQRVYTDDGQGNGHITASGLRFLEELTSEPPPSSLERSVNPIIAALIADRASTRREYQSLIAATIAAAHTPPWTWTRLPGAEIDEKSGSLVWRERFPTIYLLMPALGRVASSAHQYAQTRDAALTAIALELFKRRHGDYPASLSELTPTFLPRVPLDIFDGSPLKYQVRSGRPLLYSVGTDRKDDAGRSPSTRHTDGASTWYPPDDIDALLADPLRGPQIDGDWVLYPRPVPKLPANQPAEDPTSEHTSDPTSEIVPE